jgi:DNA-binding beta-propeller fold protein YncE
MKAGKKEGLKGSGARWVGCLLLLCCLNIGLFAQDAVKPAEQSSPSEEPELLGTDMNALQAVQAFRLGIQSYNRYNFNEAIYSFEHALSLRPRAGIILDYLGRAYYRSGMEETALRQWRAAAATDGTESSQAVLINNRVEVVQNRRSLYREMDENTRFVQAGRFPGKIGANVLFRQPSAVLPLEDGTAWFCCYGSNELVRVDVNGIIHQRIRGEVTAGLDRPYDIARDSDGNLYVSELLGGRVSVFTPNGRFKRFIGSKGDGPGQFVGAASIALDSQGYLYAVDYGRRVILKFAPDGTFITEFGKASGAFDGFVSPTGLACENGLLYAADNVRREIVSFDENGAFAGVVCDSGLDGPESLRVLPNGNLLISDINQLKILTPSTGILRDAGLVGNPNGKRIRVTDARPDVNGGILACDFTDGEVESLADMDDVASGLFVQINRVDVDKFPTVSLEIEVEDRARRPIVGLAERNFNLTENNNPVANARWLGAGENETRAALAVVFERSPGALALRDKYQTALADITAAFPNADISVIDATATPVFEPFDGSLSSRNAAAWGTDASYSPKWRFDTAIRLAVGKLLPLSKKRAVIFVGAGEPAESAFEKYSFSELAAYMANNGISFYGVLAGGGAPSPEGLYTDNPSQSASDKRSALSFLSEETGGEILRLFRPQGIGVELRKILTKPCGIYYLQYTCALPTNFGRRFLPIEAEVYLQERSGRDSIGYFPPLE